MADVIGILGGPLFGRRAPQQGDGGSGFDPNRRNLTPDEQKREDARALERERRRGDIARNALREQQQQHADALQEAADAAAQQRQQHADALQERQELLDDRTRVLNDQMRQLAQRTTALDELRVRLDYANTLIAQQQGQIAEGGVREEEMLRAIEQKEGELRDLQVDITQYEENIQGLEVNVQGLEEEKQRARETIEDLQGERNQLANENNGIKITLQGVRTELGQLQGAAGELADAKTQLEMLTNQKNALGVQIQQMQANESRHAQSLRAQRELTEKANQEATAARIKNRQLKAELDSVERQHAEELQGQKDKTGKKKDKIKALKAELKKAEVQARKSMQNIGKCRREKGEALQERDRAQQEVRNLKAENKAQLDDIRALNGKLYALQGDSSSSSAANSSAANTPLPDSSDSSGDEAFVTPRRASSPAVGLRVNTLEEAAASPVPVGDSGAIGGLSDFWQSSVEDSQEVRAIDFTRVEILSVLKWWLFQAPTDDQAEGVFAELVEAYQAIKSITGVMPQGAETTRGAGGDLRIAQKIDRYRDNLIAPLKSLRSKLTEDDLPRAIGGRRVTRRDFIDRMVVEFENLGVVNLKAEIMSKAPAPQSAGLLMLDSPNLTLRL